ncbi:MAG: hypothetical protein RML40_02520 [Bacteroidota bacterium]|nr:glycosyltransferase family 2 protein [Candidatus Kapabacteria bacterium]MDW8219384.1 hypothetical protein [Bacteroidota bacterium]
MGGRNFQLNLCKTSLIAFIDDDVTLHGYVFAGILNVLRSLPIAAVGVPSFIGQTDVLSNHGLVLLLW